MSNVKHLITIVIAAASLVGAAPAMAGNTAAPPSSGEFAYGERGADHEALLSFKSTKTRAEVRAEALANRTVGEFAYGERGVDHIVAARFQSATSRSQVRAEALKAPTGPAEATW